ncbi:hypothetical protein G6F60_015472 [Rhizopus arrhizus]|nr:hypothetical protein G6F60_015472 [Rhizopus arrhizus]
MLVGNSSAFTTALIDVYPAVNTHAPQIKRKAMKGARVFDKVIRMGTVSAAPATPKKIRSGLRPILSDSAPYCGCRISAKINEAAMM